MKLELKELNSGYIAKTRIPMTEKNILRIKVAAILLAAFLLVFILCSTGLIPLNAIGVRIGSFLRNDQKAFPISLTSENVSNMCLIDENILILNNESVYIYSPSGNELFSSVLSYSSPSVNVFEDTAFVFDRGGKNYMIIKDNKLLYEGTTDSDIICVQYGAKGNYAISTRSSEATCVLTVYNKNHKPVFKWNCAHEHIARIALSPDGKYAAAAVMSAENGDVYTKVKFFGFNYKDELNSQTVSGASAFDLVFTSSNTVTLFTDNGIYEVKKNSDKYDVVKEYYSSEFNSYSIAPNGKYCLCIAKYGSANVFEISVFSKEGREKRTVSCDVEIKSVCMSDKYVFALAENRIMVYNFGGKMVSDISFSGEAYNIYGTDSYIFIHSLNKLSRCFAYGKSDIKLGS